MSIKSPECWSNDPQARGLRVEISAEFSILLPHDQFAFSELNSNGNEQQLRFVFATHQVTVRGYSLRRIETAMQRLQLSLLVALPGKQRSLIPDGEPVIVEIALSQANAVEEGARTSELVEAENRKRSDRNEQ